MENNTNVAKEAQTYGYERGMLEAQNNLEAKISNLEIKLPSLYDRDIEKYKNNALFLEYYKKGFEMGKISAISAIAKYNARLAVHADIFESISGNKIDDKESKLERVFKNRPELLEDELFTAVFREEFFKSLDSQHAINMRIQNESSDFIAAPINQASLMDIETGKTR